jgi:ABC-type multidrug transport system fused ATPase/permease subunit
MLTWIALAFLLVALVASVTVAFLRGRRLWRHISSFSGEAETALDKVMSAAAITEERSAAFTANQERLTKANERLQISLAELAILRAAADEARAKFDRLREILPTK